MKKLEIDTRDILNRLELNDDRKKISLYLSSSLYKEFQEVCGKAPASRVMEELMKLFVERAKEQK